MIRIHLNCVQRGYFTVVIVAVLAVLALLASRTMTVSSQDSVRLSIQEQTYTEALYAAEQVMEQALVWYQSNTPAFTGGVSPVYTSTEAGVDDIVIAASRGGTSVDRTYESSFWFQEGTGDEVRVFAQASNEQGSQTVSQWIENQVLLTSLALNSPLVMAGCFGTLNNGKPAINGTPQINAHPNSEILPSGVSSLTLPAGCGTPANVTGPCNNNPFFGKLNKGQGSQCTEPIAANLTSSNNLWSTVFSLSQTEIRTFADGSSTDNVHWIESGDSQSGLNSYGSASEPMILVLEDCPNLPANQEIIGLIYSFGSSCPLQGSGGQMIKGAIIFDNATGTSISSWNANDVIEAAYLEGEDSHDDFSVSNQVAFDETQFASKITVVPGTWIDTDIN